ncbi:MAG: ribonuclease J [Ruminococcaceae bacterium]|nr:ribonuclease J [Oscillospiraceae bacterium]
MRQTNVQKEKPKEKSKLKIISLGGLGEIGKNITIVEYENDIIIIDCGLGFPDEEMPGIDLVIPDVTYLEENAHKIRGLVLTHGHEDHIGAIPYILRQINPPIFGTRLTLGILQHKLSEHPLPNKPSLNCVEAGDVVRLGVFSVEFIHVNHSIADACALAISTPVGMLIHSGDLKIDVTPIDGDMIDLTRFGELGKKGVLLFMCESTNAERAGHSPSEKSVGRSLEYIFTLNKDKRIVIATFSSNVHRVQQIIDASVRHSRKVAITGRSMLNIVGAAVELGYMNLPQGALIDINEIKRYKPEEITVITTGSQGEPMSALFRMAAGDHSQITLGAKDLVVLSSSPIPGNEKLISRIVNELVNHGVSVLRDSAFEVHVSGHAYRDELKLLTSLVKPKFFMPIHGEYRHLAANKELAEEVGIDSSRIIISDVGKIIELDKKSAKFNGTVVSGKVLVDGYGVGDVGNIVLNDRRHLSQDGLIVVVAAIDRISGMLISGPEIISRGFVYVREAEELIEEIREIAAESIERCYSKSRRPDRIELKNTLKDDLAKYLYQRTKRKPMILPVIMDM